MLEIVGVSPVLFARKPKSISRLASSFLLRFFAFRISFIVINDFHSDFTSCVKFIMDIGIDFNQ